jgi:hypothetical protein
MWMKSDAATKKPKVQIKRVKAALGAAYRIYIDGEYRGAGLTRESAREAAKQLMQNRKNWARSPTQKESPA